MMPNGVVISVVAVSQCKQGIGSLALAIATLQASCQAFFMSARTLDRVTASRAVHCSFAEAAQVSHRSIFSQRLYLLQDDPEPTKAKLEKFLGSKGIPYKYGTKTKFANFRQRTLE